jgi:hypothetical protein
MRVELVRDVVVDGALHRAGEVVDLDAGTAMWLLQDGAAVPHRGEFETATKRAPERAITRGG